MADAVQTSYTKDTYFDGMATIANFAGQGYEVVGYNTVLDPKTSEPTWYVLMVKKGKSGFDIDVNVGNSFHNPIWGRMIEAIGTPLK